MFAEMEGKSYSSAPLLHIHIQLNKDNVSAGVTEFVDAVHLLSMAKILRSLPAHVMFIR